MHDGRGKLLDFLLPVTPAKFECRVKKLYLDVIIEPRAEMEKWYRYMISKCNERKRTYEIFLCLKKKCVMKIFAHHRHSKAYNFNWKLLIHTNYAIVKIRYFLRTLIFIAANIPF